MRVLNVLKNCLYILLLLPMSCSTPEQPVQIKNTGEHQTSHIFSLPISQMRNAIISAFQIDNQFNSKLLHSVFHNRLGFSETGKGESLNQVIFKTETKTDTLFSKEYFKVESKNNIYLHAFGEFWDSSVYYANNKPLEFGCEFAFSLDSMDSEKTKVTVEVLHPRVINGTIGIGPHGYIAREVAVTPTTVEEATLLKYLATELHNTSKIR